MRLLNESSGKRCEMTRNHLFIGRLFREPCTQTHLFFACLFVSLRARRVRALIRIRSIIKDGALYARHVFRALDIHGSGGVTFTVSFSALVDGESD